MNYLDIVFALLVVWAAWVGFKKGFVIELFTFLALFVGLYAGIHFSNFATKLITEDFDMHSEYTPAIAFTVTFLAVGAMVYFAGKAIEKAIKVVQLSPLNKLAGMAFGVLKAAFLIGGFTLVVDAYDKEEAYVPNNLRNGSVVYRSSRAVTKACMPALEESTKFVQKSLVKNNDQPKKS